MYDIEDTILVLYTSTQTLITSLINIRVEEELQAQESSSSQEVTADDPELVSAAIGSNSYKTGEEEAQDRSGNEVSAAYTVFKYK